MDNVAQQVMEHVRALRQALLTGGPDPVHDQERSGMTGPQVAVMSELVRSGPSTVTELAGRLHLSHSTMSGIVGRLETAGLLTRTRDEHDRRITRIAVVDIVHRYVHDLDHGPYGQLKAVLERATPQEREVVLDGLTTLRKLLANG